MVDTPFSCTFTPLKRSISVYRQTHITDHAVIHILSTRHLRNSIYLHLIFIAL